jgi:hypothetical protein
MPKSDSGAKYRKDETGNTYGKLTVVAYAGKDWKKGAQWLCRCACGGQKVVTGATLRAGYNKTCGCDGRGPRPTKTPEISLQAPG